MNEDIKIDFIIFLLILIFLVFFFLGNINIVNNDGYEMFGSNIFEMKNNVDFLK